MTALRYTLIGDGLSPHLLKWARTLHQVAGDRIELAVVSSRGLLPAFEPLIPPERQLLLHTTPRHAGGNVAVLRHLPRVAAWLRSQPPQVLHAHYLTSHGTLAWLSQKLWRVPGVLVCSAWGSDVLVTPRRSAIARRLTRSVLQASTICTADSRHMAREMLRMGAREVDVFPFGLEACPPAPAPGSKDPDLFFSNRGLEPLYRIDRVLSFFAIVAESNPRATLIVANEGSQRRALEQRAQALGLANRVTFTGLLRSDEQARWYERAQWHLSLPESDSVSVSVLEAMAHGCIPVLSDLPANRELITHTLTGWVLSDDVPAFLRAAPELLERAPDIAAANRDWVQRHGLFPAQVARFLQEVLKEGEHRP